MRSYYFLNSEDYYFRVIYEFVYFCIMEDTHQNNPLHGITLQKILEDLVAFYGFDTLGELIKIKCFTENPSIKSSLTFLRKTEWARSKVENLYVRTLPKLAK
jgi:uncharacterized protein (DUF2132 family)